MKKQTKKLAATSGESFYSAADFHHKKQDFTKALSLYYEALDHLPKTNSYYLAALQSIGELEYTFTKDYLKSAKAYAQVINLKPKEYEYYPKLIKAYNGAEEYAKADRLFELMKDAYNNKELSENYTQYKNVAIVEYEWNGQKITGYKYIVDPKKVLDISYRVNLHNKAGDGVERTFLVEQTMQLRNCVKHILCEKGLRNGIHCTYPYGWYTDIILLADLKKAIGLILDGKIDYLTAATFFPDPRKGDL